MKKLLFFLMPVTLLCGLAEAKPKFPVGMSLEGNKINSVATPVTGTDAANKDYIDDHINSATQHPTLPLDHNAAGDLSNTGTYSHTGIDSHIDAGSIHFPESSINHTNIGSVGANTHLQIDSHISSTSNPHSVTATQVGKDTAQWNADELKGVALDDTALVTGFIWKYDGNNWICSADAGGGGSPGGSDTQVQFNDSGSFGGDAGLTYDKTTDTLSPKNISLGAGGQMDFNKLQAVEMVMHNGATLPTSPADGQIFYHKPTGRKIKYVYNSTAAEWEPERSFGSATMYVNINSGSDGLGKGYGTGTDAFATIGFAIAAAPPGYGGDVTINLADGIYSETLVIANKVATGDYNFILKGEATTLVSDLTANIHTNTTIGKTGETWTVNAYANKRVSIVSGTGAGQTSIITSNSATTLTICANSWGWTDPDYFGVDPGGVTPDGTSVFRVEGWGAKITSSDQETITIDGSKGVLLDTIHVDNTFSGSNGTGVFIKGNGHVGVWGCLFEGTGTEPVGIDVRELSILYARSSMFDSINKHGIGAVGLSAFNVHACYILDSGNKGIQSLYGNQGVIRGCRIAGSVSDGVFLTRNTSALLQNNTIISNGGYGVRCADGAVGVAVSGNTFTPANTSGDYSPANMTGEPGGNN